MAWQSMMERYPKPEGSNDVWNDDDEQAVLVARCIVQVDEFLFRCKNLLLEAFPQEHIRERIKSNMIKVQRSNAPQGNSISKGIQFLSPRHITAPEGHIATINKVTTDKPDNFGNPDVVYFTMKGEKYSKGFKETSPMLIQLVDLLGDDEKKWTGKEIVIGKAMDPDREGERLVVHAVPSKEKKQDRIR